MSIALEYLYYWY